MGKRRSVRTAAEQQSESDSGSRISQKRSTKGKAKAQSRVPVTALIAWPTFHSQEWDRRSTNRWQHRLKREHPTCTERIKSLIEECGWKGGDSGGDSVEKKPCPTKERQNQLDSDRPSHGRRIHSEPRWRGGEPFMMAPKGYFFRTGQNRVNRAFRISGFRVTRSYPFTQLTQS